MDKFADGDPTNNDFFGSPFEWDWRETNLRFGGDLAGLESKLDYLAGMGIKAIFASGTPWINMLWQADGAPISTPLAVPQLTFAFSMLFFLNTAHINVDSVTAFITPGAGGLIP
jgi:alpha-1,3-glucan synthase